MPAWLRKTTKALPRAEPMAPKTIPKTTVSVSTMASTKLFRAPMARIVPISRILCRVAMTTALLMMTSATTKIMAVAK